MNQDYDIQVQLPQWAQGKYLDELGCVQEFLLLHPMIYVDGVFYSKQGRQPEDRVRKLLYDYISGFLVTSLSKKVHALMEVLKLECRKERLPLSESRIHCANGYFDLATMTFQPVMDFCAYRLPVRYNADAPRPELWVSFVNDLLEGGDDLTLQEFLGYCLIPVNYAQKMLMIIGSGGEGKSRIGIVMSALMGSAMANGSLSKLESSPFARADLQGRLLLVDDDLRMEALKSTNYIKSLVTAEQPLDLERKGVQSYQGLVHCRLMAFGNESLRSLHDRSNGFFRRQIILTAKPRPQDRVDDPYLAQRLKGELEGIFQWCLCGLERLLINDMQFTITPWTQKNLDAAVAEGNNVQLFLQSDGYLQFHPARQITCQQLYDIYRVWCQDNLHTPMSPKSFTACVNQLSQRWGLTYSTKVPGGSGKKVRGFQGIGSGYSA